MRTRTDTEAQTEVVGETLMVVTAVVLAAIAMVFFLSYTGLLQDESRAAVTFSVNQATETVTVTAVTMGNSDAVVVRGLESYPTEDGGEPVLERAGESVRFEFADNDTERSGTLSAVGVRGGVTDSDDTPRYGESRGLRVVDEGATQTVLQTRSFSFESRR